MCWELSQALAHPRAFLVRVLSPLWWPGLMGPRGLNWCPDWYTGRWWGPPLPLHTASRPFSVLCPAGWSDVFHGSQVHRQKLLILVEASLRTGTGLLLLYFIGQSSYKQAWIQREGKQAPLKGKRVKYFVIVVVQSFSHIQLFVTPRTAACQASLSFTIFQSLLKLLSVESMMLSSSVVPFSSCL